MEPDNPEAQRPRAVSPLPSKEQAEAEKAFRDTVSQFLKSPEGKPLLRYLTNIVAAPAYHTHVNVGGQNQLQPFESVTFVEGTRHIARDILVRAQMLG